MDETRIKKKKKERGERDPATNLSVYLFSNLIYP